MSLGTTRVIGATHAEQEQLAAMGFAEVAEALAVLNASGRFLTVNPAFEQLTRFTGAEVFGKSAHFFINGGARHLLRSLAAAGQADGEVWCRRQHEKSFLVHLSLRAVRDASGAVTHYVASARDLSAQRAAEASVHALAFYDGLTGLPNRNLLVDRACQMIAVHKREAAHFALLFLDFDNFKLVNDSLGHLAGDSLLQAAARCLQSAVRETDTAARWGGDEFVLLLPNSGRELAIVIAERVLQALEPPHRLQGHTIALGASIGAVTYPDHGANFETLVKNAGVAMRHAKNGGGRRYTLYTPTQGEEAPEEVAMAGALREALEGDVGLDLHYQPQLDVHTLAVIGFEALARWRHPQLGGVSPSAFIPVAETNGHIAALGYWVLARACRDLKVLSALGYEHARMAVNVSVVQLRDPDFAARCLQIMDECKVAATRIELEVTESILLRDRQSMFGQLLQLREHGVSVALGDFGNGFSSLAYLQQLPVDKVKIDRSFVSGLSLGADARAIVKVIIGLAHSLRLRCLAEGVETNVELETLRTFGCDFAQGYHLARPVPLGVLQGWLAKAGRRQRRSVLTAFSFDNDQALSPNASSSHELDKQRSAAGYVSER
jgi:diguanylate cyclase (GGDEF)-like protein/PAS domain S-box-containing protein